MEESELTSFSSLAAERELPSAYHPMQ